VPKHLPLQHDITVRGVEDHEVGKLLGLIRELSDSHPASTLVECDEKSLRSALFGVERTAHCEMLVYDDAAVGFLFWTYTFCPFKGRRGILVSDFFVQPGIRNKGVGHAALAHLARRCVAEGLGSVEWLALSWDEAALSFYRTLGADILDDWLRCRLGPEQFWRLAHDDGRRP
jgi:GNAT superfamily N-acetyltransferase